VSKNFFFSFRYEKENICFDVDIVVKEKQIEMWFSKELVHA